MTEHRVACIGCGGLVPDHGQCGHHDAVQQRTIDPVAHLG
jgi:hypothetical protein